MPSAIGFGRCDFIRAADFQGGRQLTDQLQVRLVEVDLSVESDDVPEVP